VGVSYGAIAGYFGGWLDNLMMRLVDVFYSVPLVCIVIFVVTFMSEDKVKTRLDAWGIDRLTVFFVIVGLVFWLTMARVVRGQVISLRHEQYIEAARALGAGRRRILVRHVVPNLLSVVIVYLTLTIPQVMLFEAFLSFLGLGVQAPDVSWGLLANQGFRVVTPVRVMWWLVLYPALMLGTTLFALNFFGDGLRDAIDPKLKDLRS
jgi:oligopeptide transport system permease protein